MAESTLSDTQEKWLALLPIVPCMLSLLGSGMVIRLIYKQGTFQFAYDRLLVAMSVSDIIFTFTQILGPFWVPAETSHRYWAVGNDATCTAVAVMYSLGTASYWYCGALSFFFLLTIRYQVSDKVFAKKYEPWVHGVAIGWPVVGLILGSFLGAYRERFMGPGCIMLGEAQGRQWLPWLLLVLPLLGMFIVVTVNNLLIFSHVRKTLKKSEKWMARSLQQQQRQAAAACDASVSSHSRSSRGSFLSVFSTVGKRLSTSIKSRRSSTNAKLKMVTGQSILYVASIYMVFIWPVAVALSRVIVKTTTEADIFWLLCINQVLQSSQGIFNIIIYIRPRYLSQRQRHKDASRWDALHAVFQQDTTSGNKRPSSRTKTPSTISSVSIQRSSFGRLDKFLTLLPATLIGSPTFDHNEHLGDDFDYEDIEAKPQTIVGVDEGARDVSGIDLDEESDSDSDNAIELEATAPVETDSEIQHA